MSMSRWPVLLAGLLLIGLALPAYGAGVPDGDDDPFRNSPVRSVTDRLYIHAHFNTSGLAVEQARGEAGQGFGVRLGHGFTSYFTLYSGLDMAFMGTDDPFMEDLGGANYALGHFDIGAQFNFGSGDNRLVPYVDTAVSGKVLVYKVNGHQSSYRGTGLTLGGGVKYFLTPSFSIDTGLYGTASILDEHEEADVIERIHMNAGSARLNIGFSWYPGR